MNTKKNCTKKQGLLKMRNKLLLVLTTLFIWAVCYQVSNTIVTHNVVSENVQHNLVVEGYRQAGFFGPSVWIGSGVLISPNGLVITAGHCVEGADFLRITLQDGRKFYIYNWYQDSVSDFAVFYLPIKTTEFSIFGDSNDLIKGDKIYNVGNANGVWDNSVFYGKVYKNHFDRMFLGLHTEFIFSTMKVFHGCSGGGVYYKNLLIGIVVMGGDGISFIVPSQKIIEVLNNNHISLTATDLR